MIDPVIDAVNVWWIIFTSLPYAITALISLSLILFIIPAIIHLLWNLR